MANICSTELWNTSMDKLIPKGNLGNLYRRNGVTEMSYHLWFRETFQKELMCPELTRLWRLIFMMRSLRQ